MISRRSIISGLGALIAAPALVRASNLMPVRGIIMPMPDLTVTLQEPANFANYAPGQWIKVASLDMQSSLPSGLVYGGYYRALCVHADGHIDLQGPYPFSVET